MKARGAAGFLRGTLRLHTSQVSQLGVSQGEEYGFVVCTNRSYSNIERISGYEDCQ